MQHGFAHGLAGNGAGIDAGAAHDLALLDQGHAFAGFGALNGGTLSGRPGADYDQIEGLHASIFLYQYSLRVTMNRARQRAEWFKRPHDHSARLRARFIT